MKRTLARHRFAWAAIFAIAWLGCWLAMGAAGKTELTNDPCAVCGAHPLRGKVWKHGTQLICDECAQIKKRCCRCGLPVRDGFAETPDGRFVCKRDLPDTILKVEEARELFMDTRRELGRLYGALLDLRQNDIAVSLFDVDYWNHEKGRPEAGRLHKRGFSNSRESGGKFYHTVALYSGQSREAIAGVCAHEVTHLWLHENVPAKREIEPQTVEAICEIVAYKLMAARNNTNEMERIRSNEYTQGRIVTMIEAETRLGLQAILEWAKQGEGLVLPASMEAPRRAPPEPPRVYVPPAPRIFESLQVQGIMGTARRRILVINDRRFEAGAEHALEIAGETVRVRCVELTETNAVLDVGGSRRVIDLRGWR